MEYKYRIYFLMSLTFFSCQISSTKLCQKDGYWYDVNNGTCKPCEPCGKKSLELEPCSEYRNTLCVDLTLFKFDFVGNTAHESSAQNLKPRRKWHEMETMGADDNDNTIIAAEAIRITQPETSSSSSSEIVVYSLWDIGVVVVLCLTSTAVLIAIVITIAKQPNWWSYSRSDNRKRRPRNRLFSRDRLSTTEYMNNLATLDRRLAMDEILEKRKRAIFEPPQLLPDEVFVDISGTIPRHFDDDNDHEPTRSLLTTNRS